MQESAALRASFTLKRSYRAVRSPLPSRTSRGNGNAPSLRPEVAASAIAMRREKLTGETNGRNVGYIFRLNPGNHLLVIVGTSFLNESLLAALLKLVL